MKKALIIFLNVLLVAAVVFGMQPGRAAAQAQASTQFQITIDHAAHLKFGLYYPVTYMFQIPAGSSGLMAQYRTDPSGSWTTLNVKTAGEIFNGVNAVRFDYASSIAYVSAAFALNSDSIYVRILDGSQNEVPATYLGMPQYYDNRHAAVSVVLDDWNSGSNADFVKAAQVLSNAQMHFTAGVITYGNPNWSLIQSWLASGYMEVASHSRLHPCNEQNYTATGYNFELQGSRNDILAALNLPYPYVPLYIEPCGYTTPEVRQAIANANFLADRGFQLPPQLNTFSAWGADGLYERAMYSYDTNNWPYYTGSQSLLDQANGIFNSVYQAGGLYTLVDHPWQKHWDESSFILVQHIQHISNRADVWYAGLGEIYLYHYVQERGVVVTPLAGPGANTPLPPTATGTPPPPTETFTPGPPTSTPTETFTPGPPTSTPTATTPPTITFTPLPPTATFTPLPATSTPTPVSGASLWGSTTPSFTTANDSNPVELGFKFRTNTNGLITALRFYKGSSNTGPHVGHLWTSSGALLAEVAFTNETASGWQTAALPTPVAVTANTVYVASYHTASGFFAVTRPYFTSGYTNLPLYAYGTNEVAGGSGVYRYGGSAFPNQTYQASNYWVDVVFTAGAGNPTATNTPQPTTTNTPLPTPTSTAIPTVTNTPLPTVTNTPLPTATNTPLPTATNTPLPTATNTPLPTATDTPQPTATNTPLPTATNTPVPTATNTPVPTATNTPLPTATNTQVPTATNTPIPTTTNTPLPTATDTPQPTATSTPLPTATNTPLPTATNTQQPTATNTPEPTATHTPLPTATDTPQPTVTNTPLPTATNTPVPTATNTPLPTATDTPLPTATNTPLPTATNTPLPTATDTPVPTATNTPPPTATNTTVPTATNTPEPTGTNTPLPTATATSVPTATFTPVPTATNTPLPTATNTPLPTATNTPVPTVTNTPLPTATDTPQPTATNTPVPTATNTPLPTATNTPLPTATNTPQPTATNTPMPTPTSTAIPTVTNTPLPTATNTPLPTATNTPVPTATNTPTATATPLPAGVSLWNGSATPAVITVNDTNAVELGVKFRSSVDGFITGVKFYKGNANTGEHLGHLWSASGTMLAEATFSNETASGWQTVSFASPVAITANTVYVASYHTNTGNFSMTRPYFTVSRSSPPLYAFRSNEVAGGNGVYRYGASGFPNGSWEATNYWVDVIFTPAQ